GGDGDTRAGSGKPVPSGGVARKGRPGSGGGSERRDQGPRAGEGVPISPGARNVEGTCSRAVRFSLRRRSRTVEKNRWCIAWPSRKRTSALVGWTLTSTWSGGNSRKRNTTA